jgi:hypothetical protein
MHEDDQVALCSILNRIQGILYFPDRHIKRTLLLVL